MTGLLMLGPSQKDHISPSPQVNYHAIQIIFKTGIRQSSQRTAIQRSVCHKGKNFLWAILTAPDIPPI